MRGLVLAAGQVLAAAAAGVDDPPKKLTADERKELEAKRLELKATADKAYQGGKYDEAGKALAETLGIARQLYPTDAYPDGHPDVASALSNLGTVYRLQGKLREAEPLAKDALGMMRRLYPEAHPGLAAGLYNLALLYVDRRMHAEAEPLAEEARDAYRRLYSGDHMRVAQASLLLAEVHQARKKWVNAESHYRDYIDMLRRLHPGDHMTVAAALSNLAGLASSRGRLEEAEGLYRDVRDMYRRLFKRDNRDVVVALYGLAGVARGREKWDEAEALYREVADKARRLSDGDHPLVADSLGGLASLQWSRGKLADAEALLREQLAVTRRLYPGDHPDVADCLNRLSRVRSDQGDARAAEQFARDALEMTRRLSRGDHLDLARRLTNLAVLYYAEGQYAAAEPLFAEALGVRRRVVAAFAARASDGEALGFLAALPLVHDPYLCNARSLGTRADRVYPEVWAEKGQLARVFEARQLSVRAAPDPAAARLLADLTENRRRRAALLLEAEVRDPVRARQRADDLRDLDRAIADQIRTAGSFPAVARVAKLAAAAPADLQRVLPAGAAVVDFVRYDHFRYDPAKPGTAGQTRTWSYAAFVLTRDAVTWVDLGPAEPIERAVAGWRRAITSGRAVPADLPAAVRALVWAKVRKELPAGTTTVYVSPDAALCGVPWTALPGDKPGTVLLEDFALATIPHAPFLLDKLWPQDPVRNPPAAALVVGGVGYDADPYGFWAAAAARTGRGPLVKPDQVFGWPTLDGAAAEADGVAAAAGRRKLPTTRLAGDRATPAAVLAELPMARVAHLATHGFFADPSFRGLYELDPKEFERTWRGERVGRVANSPLLMTGLVLAGANRPGTPGRGILTGDALVDLDLSGLGLAVLSACETGLGDVAGGEGVFGLQRAFHYAGCRDVVATLWKVDDAATAALMGEFYHQLWEKGQPPVEALRQAQLAVMRADGKQFGEMARGFKAGKVDLTTVPVKADPKDPASGNHPRLWAAFILSGPGR
ncbi:MAG: hypothetical protein C0501_11225 [Isosphaera sp.]|nr:hypothetical protein [Isosphaera sp.]